MPKAYFVVRSVVEPPLRQRFDQRYSSHHLPMALSEFKAEKCWRFWSALDAGVHYPAYQFADLARLDAALNSDGFKMLVADFDGPGRMACPARAIGSNWWRSEAGRSGDGVAEPAIACSALIVAGRSTTAARRYQCRVSVGFPVRSESISS
jgi:hypothetical protein